LIGPDSPTGGTPYSYAVAINNASAGAQIAGYVDYSRSGSGYEGDSQAFLYSVTGGTMSMLGTPIGSDTTRGYGLNDSGVVVGTAYEYYYAKNGVGLENPTNYEFWRAAIFENGSVYYLDDLLTGSNLDGYFLNSAMSINDSGQIVGFATAPGGVYHAVLLTPTTGTASAPPATSEMKATDLPGTGIQVVWQDNSGGKAYTNIEVNSGSGFTSIGLEQPGTATSLTDSDVTPGVAYTFEAIAENSVGAAAASNTSTATYTVPAPIVTSITPTSTPDNKAVTVTVAGKNFYKDSVVEINGVSITTTYKSATKLKAAITATDIKTPGEYAITVITGVSNVSNSVNLKATGPILAVTIGTITRTTVLSVPVKVTNSGNAAGDAVTVTSAVLGTADTTSTLPVVLGTIGAGANASTTLVFPTTAGKSGKKELLTVKGTYTGGTIKFSATELLP
jgi:hypothetical protein